MGPGHEHATASSARGGCGRAGLRPKFWPRWGSRLISRPAGRSGTFIAWWPTGTCILSPIPPRRRSRPCAPSGSAASARKPGFRTPAGSSPSRCSRKVMEGPGSPALRAVRFAVCGVRRGSVEGVGTDCFHQARRAGVDRDESGRHAGREQRGDPDVFHARLGQAARRDCACRRKPTRESGPISVERNDVVMRSPDTKSGPRRTPARVSGSARMGSAFTSTAASIFPRSSCMRRRSPIGPMWRWFIDDGTPSLYLNGRFARNGLRGRTIAHPGVGVIHGRELPAFRWTSWLDSDNYQRRWAGRTSPNSPAQDRPPPIWTRNRRGTPSTGNTFPPRGSYEIQPLRRDPAGRTFPNSACWNQRAVGAELRHRA